MIGSDPLSGTDTRFLTGPAALDPDGAQHGLQPPAKRLLRPDRQAAATTSGIGEDHFHATADGVQRETDSTHTAPPPADQRPKPRSLRCTPFLPPAPQQRLPHFPPPGRSATDRRCNSIYGTTSRFNSTVNRRRPVDLVIAQTSYVLQYALLRARKKRDKPSVTSGH